MAPNKFVDGMDPSDLLRYGVQVESKRSLHRCSPTNEETC